MRRNNKYVDPPIYSCVGGHIMCNMSSLDDDEKQPIVVVTWTFQGRVDSHIQVCPTAYYDNQQHSTGPVVTRDNQASKYLSWIEM